VASLWESVCTGTKEDESRNGRVWAAGISPCYGPFWLGARFETYEPFISLIFHFSFRTAANRGYGGPPVPLIRTIIFLCILMVQNILLEQQS